MQHKEGRHRWHHGVQPGLGVRCPAVSLSSAAYELNVWES